MLSYKESLKILKETNALMEGHFVLSSGLHSEQYIQCAKLLSHPNKAQKICKSLAEKITNSKKKIDLVLAPAMGGVVIGYEIGKLLKKETIFAERVEGNFILRRGFSIPPNSKVLIVEDVITTGKSSLECAKIVIENKAQLVGFACIIDRSNEGCLIKEEIISQIKIDIKTFHKNDLPEHLKNLPAEKPGSRNLNK